jgi:hypothetical protein
MNFLNKNGFITDIKLTSYALQNKKTIFDIVSAVPFDDEIDYNLSYDQIKRDILIEEAGLENIQHPIKNSSN